MQFTNRIENIGQIFHELVLVPLTFFQDNLVPIHAAGFSSLNKGILLGKKLSPQTVRNLILANYLK